jgi:hypothetical protein
MNLFRIETIARNNNLTILQGFRFNESIFSVYISRYNNINNIENFRNYIYSNGVYYIVSIFNGNNNNIHNMNNIHNFYWENVNYTNNNFSLYNYGIDDIVSNYIKGLILT